MAIAARQLQTEGFTVEDVLAMPEDGLRYELFDGMLIVNPPPIVGHQIALARLLALLDTRAHPGWLVLPAPVGWRPGLQRWFEPDLVVFDDFPGAPELPHLVNPPALVVEVLSPRTRAYDQTLKRQAYDEGGVGAYWIVGPSAAEPSVVFLERGADGGSLVEVSRAVGTEVARATRPWPVEIVPTDLIR